MFFDFFKEKVKEHVKRSALEYLQNLQQTHSKSRSLTYTKLDLQDYLKADSDMKIREKAFTFYLRSRMIDLKCNFKSIHTDLKCRLCGKHEENQEGLLICEVLREQSDTTADYSDIFCQDKAKICTTAMTLKRKFEKFEHYQVHGQTTLNGQPSAAPSNIVKIVNDELNVNDGDMV